MSSILTNSSALSALQALQQTQQEMAQTESQVSTGLAVVRARCWLDRNAATNMQDDRLCTP